MRSAVQPGVMNDELFSAGKDILVFFCSVLYGVTSDDIVKRALYTEGHAGASSGSECRDMHPVCAEISLTNTPVYSLTH